MVDKGQPWDSELRFVDSQVNKAMRELGARLVENLWWQIAPEVHAKYDDEQCNCSSYTDALAEGWGATSRWGDGTGFEYQQRWESDLADLQRRQKGCRGIGRGYALDSLLQHTNGLFHEGDIQVGFLYVAGESNTADDLGVPVLRNAYSPVCE